MEIKKVGVLGCGLMGSGIAQVAAMAGFDVSVLEVEQKYLDKGFVGIEKSLAKFAERPVDKGGITAAAERRGPRAAEGERPTGRTLPIATSSSRPSSKTCSRSATCTTRSTGS